MDTFATVEDVDDLWRPLKPDEAERVKKLLPIISDTLRYEAVKVGKDLDQMSEEIPGYANVVKSVTIDITTRLLLTSTNAEPMTQVTQSALGYSVSGTYLVPGGGMFIKNSELARLGLRRQRYGGIELYGNDKGNDCNPV